jgi:hypothetical protein
LIRRYFRPIAIFTRANSKNGKKDLEDDGFSILLYRPNALGSSPMTTSQGRRRGRYDGSDGKAIEGGEEEKKDERKAAEKRTKKEADSFIGDKSAIGNEFKAGTDTAR